MRNIEYDIKENRHSLIEKETMSSITDIKKTLPYRCISEPQTCLLSPLSLLIFYPI